MLAFTTDRSDGDDGVWVRGGINPLQDQSATGDGRRCDLRHLTHPDPIDLDVLADVMVGWDMLKSVERKEEEVDESDSDKTDIPGEKQVTSWDGR